MLKAWLISGLVVGIMMLPVVQNFQNPSELKRYINRFFYLSVGSFVLMIILALMA